MQKFFIRGADGRIIGEREGRIFRQVLDGVSYTFGRDCDGNLTELSSGWRVARLPYAAELGKFADAVRNAAALAAKYPPLPPLPNK